MSGSAPCGSEPTSAGSRRVPSVLGLVVLAGGPPVAAGCASHPWSANTSPRICLHDRPRARRAPVRSRLVGHRHGDGHLRVAGRGEGNQPVVGEGCRARTSRSGRCPSWPPRPSRRGNPPGPPCPNLTTLCMSWSGRWPSAAEIGPFHTLGWYVLHQVALRSRICPSDGGHPTPPLASRAGHQGHLQGRGVTCSWPMADFMRPGDRRHRPGRTTRWCRSSKWPPCRWARPAGSAG